MSTCRIESGAGVIGPQGAHGLADPSTGPAPGRFLAPSVAPGLPYGADAPARRGRGRHGPRPAGRGRDLRGDRDPAPAVVLQARLARRPPGADDRHPRAAPPPTAG